MVTSAISQYESGRVPSDPRVASRLADLFGVRLAWLLTGEGPMVAEEEAPYTLPEASFTVVAPEEARAALRRAGDLYRAVPLLRDPVAAGPPRLVEEKDVEGYALIYYQWAKEGSYCIRVKGDSMVPVFREGDLVGISPWKKVLRLLRGRFVAAWLEDEGLTVKRLQLTRKFVILEPLNLAYPPRFFDAAEPPQLWRVDWWWGHQP